MGSNFAVTNIKLTIVSENGFTSFCGGAIFYTYLPKNSIIYRIIFGIFPIAKMLKRTF